MKGRKITLSLINDVLDGKQFINEWNTKLFYANGKINVTGPNVPSTDDYIFVDNAVWKEIKEIIDINGLEVSKPETKPLNDGDRYFYPSFAHLLSNGVAVSTWTGGESDIARLEAGIVHTTIGDAIKHAEALISFSGKL